MIQNSFKVKFKHVQKQHRNYSDDEPTRFQTFCVMYLGPWDARAMLRKNVEVLADI